MPNAPYNGAAPPPARSMALAGGEPAPTNVGAAEVDGTHIIDPGDLTPGIDRGHTYTSQPPADPTQAAKAAENDGRIGELVQALGAQKAEYEQRMSDMAYQFESQLAAALARLNPTNNIPLPANLDPDTPVNVSQLATVLGNFRNQVKIDTLRSTAGLTPTEEADALTRFPHLRDVPEPQKTELLVQAVTRMRSASPAASKSTPANGTLAQSSVERITRQAPRTVPFTEASNAIGVEDNPPINQVAQIQADYAATAQIKDPKERMRARRAIMDRARAASGMTEEQFAKASWAQR